MIVDKSGPPNCFRQMHYLSGAEKNHHMLILPFSKHLIHLSLVGSRFEAESILLTDDNLTLTSMILHSHRSYSLANRRKSMKACARLSKHLSFFFSAVRYDDLRGS